MLERNYLVTAEVDRLLAATQGSRNEARDRCLLRLRFRHGLRASEACGPTRSPVDVESRGLHVARHTQRLSTPHPLRGDEVRLIKAWLKERNAIGPVGEDFFVRERRAALSRKTLWAAVRCDGELAGLPLPARPGGIPASDPVWVRRPAALDRASARPRLTATPWHVGSPSALRPPGQRTCTDEVTRQPGARYRVQRRAWRVRCNEGLSCRRAYPGTRC